MRLDVGKPGKYQGAAKRRSRVGGRVRPRKTKKVEDKTWLGRQKYKENVEELTGKREGFGPDTGRGQRDWDYKASTRGAGTKSTKKMKLKPKTKKTSKMPIYNPKGFDRYVKEHKYTLSNDV